jgi:molybdenum cofactor biosynthesis protein MoaC
MFDVSNKIKTLRSATAQALLKVSPATLALIREGKIPKGNPLEVAKVAGVQAAKNTSQIIPYCHPIPIEFVGVEFTLHEASIEVNVSIKATYKTGVEIEAITAASVAALTLYDMMKMLDDAMEIQSVRLLSKKGGKGDFRESFETKPRAAVLVLSDSVSAGTQQDQSGKAIVERLEREGVEVSDYRVIPDDSARIEEALIHYSDELHLDLVMTTGGTGLGPRDVTPEAMDRVIEREIPGIIEAAQAYGRERTPLAMFSRAKAGLRGNTLIVNLPGSKKAVEESLDALFPALLHSRRMIAGEGH